MSIVIYPVLSDTGVIQFNVAGVEIGSFNIFSDDLDFSRYYIGWCLIDYLDTSAL